MNSIDLNMDVLDVIEAAEMDGVEVAFYGTLAFIAGVGFGILVAT
ncbi:MAG TPA: hypothetical protein VF619_01780 [Allosphingosinicella sp.]|jgi:hypothetical protein